MTSPTDIIGYQWVVNEHHARLAGADFDPAKGYGGDQVYLGQTGPVFPGEPYPNDRWGLDQILYLRDGSAILAPKDGNY